MIYLHIHSEYSQHPAFTYPHTIPSLPKLCGNGVATTQWWDCETALFDPDGRCLRCLNTWRCCKGGLRHSGWFPEAWWVWTWNLEIRKIGWKLASFLTTIRPLISMISQYHQCTSLILIARDPILSNSAKQASAVGSKSTFLEGQRLLSRHALKLWTWLNSLKIELKETKKIFAQWANYRNSCVDPPIFTSTGSSFSIGARSHDLCIRPAHQP